MQSKMNNQDYALCFVGNILPDKWKSEFAKHISPNNDIQINLLKGFVKHGKTPDLVLSYLPHALSESRYHLQVPGTEEILFDDVKVRYLGYCDIRFFRYFILAISLMINIVKWGFVKKKEGLKVTILAYNLNFLPFIFCASRLIGGKLICFIADIYFDPYRNMTAYYSNILTKITLWFVKRLDGVIALNGNVLIDFGCGERGVLINGLIPDDHFILELSKLPLVNKASKCILLYMGSLNIPRGVEMLLKAFSLVDGEEFELIIAGKGALEKRVKNAVQADKRIKYLGFLDKNDILEAYRQASVVVNPHLYRDLNSRYIFPSKLFEGMASGRPVISTNIGNVMQFFGDYLYGSMDDTPESFARAIVEFSQTSISERREKALQARDFVIHHKLWEHQSKDCLIFLDSISKKAI